MKTIWQSTPGHEPAYKRGEEVAQAKLNAEAVEDIRSAFKQRTAMRKYMSENLSTKALAKRFGVSDSTVEAVASGRSWGHV